MSAIDFQQLFKSMLDAAKESLSDRFPTAKELATSSLKTLAMSIVDIQKMRESGTITEEQARLKIDLHKNAFKTVLLTEEGLGLLAVEAALNAAIGVVKDAINTAIGFVLL